MDNNRKTKTISFVDHKERNENDTKYAQFKIPSANVYNRYYYKEYLKKFFEYFKDINLQILSMHRAVIDIYTELQLANQSGGLKPKLMDNISINLMNTVNLKRKINWNKSINAILLLTYIIFFALLRPGSQAVIKLKLFMCYYVDVEDLCNSRLSLAVDDKLKKLNKR